MLNYNHKDADKGGDRYEPLPVGEYDAVIAAVDEDVSKTSGDPMYKVTLEVYSGNQKRPLWDYIVMTEKMVWKLKQYARAMGAEAEFDDEAFDLNAYEGNGLRVNLSIRNDLKYGNQNNVKSILPKPGASIKKRGVSAPSDRPGGAGTPTDPGRHVAVSEDDIPF